SKRSTPPRGDTRAEPHEAGFPCAHSSYKCTSVDIIEVPATYPTLSGEVPGNREHPTMTSRLLSLLILLAAATARADDKKPDAAGFEQKVKPLLAKYCTHCHGGKEKAGGLALDQFSSVPSVVEKRSVWLKMARNLNARIMPPEGNLLPSGAEIEFLVGWIQ